MTYKDIEYECEGKTYSPKKVSAGNGCDNCALYNLHDSVCGNATEVLNCFKEVIIWIEKK